MCVFLHGIWIDFLKDIFVLLRATWSLVASSKGSSLGTPCSTISHLHQNSGAARCLPVTWSFHSECSWRNRYTITSAVISGFICHHHQGEYVIGDVPDRWSSEKGNNAIYISRSADTNCLSYMKVHGWRFVWDSTLILDAKRLLLKSL